MREYRELQALLSQLEEKAEGIKKAIVEVMEAEQTEELAVDIFKVGYTIVKSNRFNTTAFLLPGVPKGMRV